MSENKKLVLVVEDEPALREVIVLKLGREELVEVAAATNGEDALVFLKKRKPSLIWLDLLLPGINGLEVLEKIRNDADLKNLPAVIVSVSAGEEKVKRAFELGALDYIVKSNNSIDDIIKKVKGILSELP
ncbi:hypothetical protein A3C91_00225 [Candidatus Azambacteria bacterium RIFCSPHIGHO2_02_FULL_52_12]|uniref:Response regulatory domain-containing protein n=1 Tax=Candidatus Azambacteria bacterium RIFCSPLOWO2_01_FULL_46_25 TaxID=1797298 RepID=A0A1F5BUK7_9BACT|nr:MAG: hypothetical protein A3C91_00225 [Candidatus Azambacteria bacterium RIFCSPHIGHO2_02_FULL_52_12]OGD34306.1 MAG: hypothetical protein A2988_02135 [Candidatus Azambacteria bacterium RIFCSPLOWO2_01_FULL_46_25]OGD37767.1 MAG: hypothetical protein A2850_03450 [Candidatus Azambacteria bacterium RIFCSPHIGHO2_01_FULL_51_74]